MELKEQKKKDTIILEVKGRLDTTNYGELEKKLTELFDNNEKNILLNFHELDYVSSAGLRVLLLFLKRAKAENGSLAICDLKKNIEDIFKISGFNTLFEIYDNQNDVLGE
ncbi:MAG: STAS domain-containing protein [Bacteroidales bacterium]|jgi:anti-anti-sigma factor|nr:STAS domain-containing protein [Bacteroidales bacterium]